MIQLILVATCFAAQPAPNAERQEIAMTKCSRDDAEGCRLSCAPVCEDEEAEESSNQENFVPEEQRPPRKSAARRVVEGD